MTHENYLADAAIRRTLAACTMAGDARKADAYAACFTIDGVLDLRNERLEGREAIREWMKAPSAIPRPRDAVAPGFVSHHLTTCRIVLTAPRTADVRTYWLVMTAAGPDHSGYYEDRFREDGDGWRVAFRRPRTLWVGPNSVMAGPAS